MGALPASGFCTREMHAAMSPAVPESVLPRTSVFPVCATSRTTVHVDDGPTRRVVVGGSLQQPGWVGVVPFGEVGDVPQTSQWAQSLE